MFNLKMFYPRHGEAVTPHDTNEVSYTGLFIGVGGTLVLRLADDSGNITLLNVPSGSFVPLECKLVLNSSTTCTNIIGFRVGDSGSR